VTTYSHIKKDFHSFIRKKTKVHCQEDNIYRIEITVLVIHSRLSQYLLKLGAKELSV